VRRDERAFSGRLFDDVFHNPSDILSTARRVRPAGKASIIQPRWSVNSGATRPRGDIERRRRRRYNVAAGNRLSLAAAPETSGNGGNERKERVVRMFPALLAKIFAFIQAVLMTLAAWGFPGVKSAAFVTFDANPSTGYTWVCDMEPEGVVAVKKEYYVPAPVPPGTVGSGGTYTFVLVPAADGETELTFLYLRTWEEPPVPVQTARYTATVENGVLHLEEAPAE